MLSQTISRKKSESPIEDYSIDELVPKIAGLAGTKNLSLTLCESDEFYDLLVYAMALRDSRFDPDHGHLVQQIKRLFPQHRRKFTTMPSKQQQRLFINSR